MNIDAEEELRFHELPPITSDTQFLEASMGSIGLDTEDINNLLDDEGAEIIFSNQELDVIRNNNTGSRSHRVSKSDSTLSLNGSDFSALLNLDVDELLDNETLLKDHIDNAIYRKEKENDESHITKNSKKPSHSPPPFNNNSKVDDLIFLQSNINNTLENLVDSMKRTEETRLLLAKQSRRNSVDSPNLTALNKFASIIPDLREEVNNEALFNDDCRKSGFGKSAPKSVPVKVNRRGSLTKPSRRESFGKPNRRSSMEKKFPRVVSVGKPKENRNRRASLMSFFS